MNNYQIWVELTIGGIAEIGDDFAFGGEYNTNAPEEAIKQFLDWDSKIMQISTGRLEIFGDDGQWEWTQETGLQEMESLTDSENEGDD